MLNVNTILLCGGKINYSNLPIHTNTSNSMIPINGKPVIGWLLEDLIEKGISTCTIVLRSENVHLKEFITRGYSNKLSIQIVEMAKSPSILHSLSTGLSIANQMFPTQVILGDTLLKDSPSFESNTVYVNEVEDSSRWCIAELGEGNVVKRYLDKVDNIIGKKLALCGYYGFSNTGSLVQSLHKLIEKDRTQMSDLLIEEGVREPFIAKDAENWYDFGNIDNLLAAKQRLLQSRFFNTLTIDPVLNTITKVSEYDEKLRDELNWYKDLPERLKVLSPRIISEKEIDGQLNLVQEYYGYPTLAELFLFSDLTAESWHSIFKKLLAIHETFQSFPHEINPRDLEFIYLEKTKKRIDTLVQDDLWAARWSEESVQINGKRYQNIATLFPAIEKKGRSICATSRGAIIHGDYCFSNILFDLSNQIVRLIDPRGSFGSKGIYGDSRYDIAKLRHSIAGLYDYIVSDLFEVNQSEGSYEMQIFANPIHQEIQKDFDSQVSLSGYNIEEIRFIEGLLFLSMLPLHADRPQRQLAMYLISVQIFNELL
jgi:dTDP-glucose pyrophosphorylase/aminoglycoside phosphotransferase